MESSYIHSEIMYDILSWTSPETLGRCRIASRQWNQTASDSSFKKLHSRRTNIADGFFVRDLINEDAFSFASINGETHKISLDFVPGSNVCVKAVSANYGILLCKSEDPRHHRAPRFFVCKPQIKVFQQIPNPRTKFLTEGVAMSVIGSNPLRYKILRISSSSVIPRNNCQSLVCELFDSETWKWKRLNNLVLPFNVWFRCWVPILSVSGVFHCLVSSNLTFSLDVAEEEWKTIRIPVNEDEYKFVKPVVYEGKLALICMDMEDYMHTWILESSRNFVWNKKFVINMKDPESEHLTFTPMAFYGSDILVVREVLSLKYYDLKNGKFLNEAKLKRYDIPCRIFPFWSDSEPCCLKPDRNLNKFIGVRQ